MALCSSTRTWCLRCRRKKSFNHVSPSSWLHRPDFSLRLHASGCGQERANDTFGDRCERVLSRAQVVHARIDCGTFFFFFFLFFISLPFHLKESRPHSTDLSRRPIRRATMKNFHSRYDAFKSRGTPVKWLTLTPPAVGVSVPTSFPSGFCSMYELSFINSVSQRARLFSTRFDWTGSKETGHGSKKTMNEAISKTKHRFDRLSLTLVTLRVHRRVCPWQIRRIEEAARIHATIISRVVSLSLIPRQLLIQPSTRNTDPLFSPRHFLCLAVYKYRWTLASLAYTRRKSCTTVSLPSRFLLCLVRRVSNLAMRTRRRV